MHFLRLERLHKRLKNIVELFASVAMETWPFRGVTTFILGVFHQKLRFPLFSPGIFDVFDANQISTSCFNIFDYFDFISEMKYEIPEYKL
jgi:hypothetical protein